MKYFLFATLFVALLPQAQADNPDTAALAKAKNCLNCHAIDRKLVGPAYRDVAARYRGDAKAQERLAQKIRHGGGGVWGVLQMPSNPQVTEAEAQALARWVLSQ